MGLFLRFWSIESGLPGRLGWFVSAKSRFPNVMSSTSQNENGTRLGAMIGG
jgi:hypothetical protein